MNRLSTNPGTEVKPKPPAFSAPFDSDDPQLEIPPADQAVKTAQNSDLQKLDPGAPAGFVLKFDIGIIDATFEHRRISLTARCILGIIEAYLNAHPRGYLSEDKIAQAAGCCRSRVSRAVNELKAVGYLGVDDSDRCNRYHVCKWVKRLDKIWVNPALVRDEGLSIAQAGFVGYIKFRQGDNEATWPTYREAAKALGVSYHTIARAAASEAVLGFVEKIHRPRRQSSKNEYYLTDPAWLETFVFEPKSARPKWGALGQTSIEENYSYANSVRRGVFSPDFSLSFDCRLDQEPYEQLVYIRTNRQVAKAIAVQQRGNHQSVRNIIINAAAAAEDYYRRMRQLGLPAPNFNLAGYAIRGLSIAMAEGHNIPLSKLAKAAKARDQGGARAAAGGRLTEAEFEQRRQEKIRRLKSTPAKPITPYTDAEMALIASKRDKEAEDQILYQAQADGSRRYFRGHKWANLPQKANISLDKAG
ncbi:hypothetical protein ES707_04927 [subsurface metagenome]